MDHAAREGGAWGIDGLGGAEAKDPRPRRGGWACIRLGAAMQNIAGGFAGNLGGFGQTSLRSGLLTPRIPKAPPVNYLITIERLLSGAADAGEAAWRVALPDDVIGIARDQDELCTDVVRRLLAIQGEVVAECPRERTSARAEHEHVRARGDRTSAQTRSMLPCALLSRASCL